MRVRLPDSSYASLAFCTFLSTSAAWYPGFQSKSYTGCTRNFGIIQLGTKHLLIRSWPIGLNIFDDEALFEEVVYVLIGYETEIV
jgi:hypothetical protein